MQGALLVRPDGHVGWRCSGEAAAAAGSEIGAQQALQLQLVNAVRGVMGFTAPRV